MLYRNFAIATLLAAPIIVMATQTFLPPKQPDTAEVQTQAPPPPPVPIPVAPPVTAPDMQTNVAPTSDFGQPMAGADQPSMAPGNGLPGAPSAGYNPSMNAPPGSPNAEP